MAHGCAFTSFPKVHGTKRYFTNPIERSNGKIKRRANFVGIFFKEVIIFRPVGAIPREQKHDGAVKRVRFRTRETIAP